LLLGILVLALLPRLIHLDSSPLGRHAWRQSDTASVARNFHENGYQLFRPQIDWAVPGYVEMEFPLYPWVTSLGYGLLGEAEWIARSLAVFGSLLAILFLFLVLRRVLSEAAALWGAFFLALLPLSLYFGRAIMPESWMLAASAAGIYWFLRWSEEDSWGAYVLSAATVGLACLLKLTNLYLGLPLLWLGWRRYGSRVLLQWKIWLHALLVAVPVGLWYWHAHELGATYGASFNILTTAGSDKWGNWALLLQPDFYSRLIFGYIAGRLVTWIGFVLLVLALFLPRNTRRERLLDVWFLAIVVVLLIANQGAYDHEYYSLPLLLPAAGFLGKLFDRKMESKRLLLTLAALAIVALSLYRYFGYLEEEAGIGVGGFPARQDSMAARILQTHTAPSEVVVSCNATNPTWLYLARRRGWGRTCAAETQISLQQLLDSGAASMFGRWSDLQSFQGKRMSRYLRATHPFAFDDGEWFVARLAERISPRMAYPKRIYASDLLARRHAELGPPVDWRFESGRWDLGSTGLRGEAVKGRFSAVAPPSLPPEVAGEVAIALRMRHLRGRGTQQGVTVQAWKQDADTHLSVVLRPRKGTMTLVLTEGGKVLFRETRPVHLRMGKLYRLGLDYDHLGFHVRLGRRPILSAPDRFSTPPSGAIALQGLNLDVEVEKLRVSVQEHGG
jgi:hypothetical protein